MRLSIQKRLFGILGLFVLANTLLWVGLALLLAYVVEDEIIDRMLASQIALVQQDYLATGALRQPSLSEVRVYQDMESVPAELREKIESPVGGGEIFTSDRTHYHFRWLQLSGRPPVLLLAEVSPWLVVTHISSALSILVTAGFIVALFLGLAAVYYIARITTRPVCELTAAIEQSPRPSPLPHCEKSDEVGVLASAMDASLRGLQRALSREKVFTRDISHELRTPLTALRNATSLLPDSMSSDPNVRQLVRSCAEIESLLEALLALARAESSVLKPQPLRAILESLLLDRADTLEQRDFELTLEVPDTVRVDANEQLSHLILGNLLDNALYYSSPPVLSVRLDENTLVLENPHISGGSTPHDRSLGHGLSLVERLAHAQGWTFSSESSSQRFIARLSW
ncbi:MAG: HAMP domain-containing sensor histidine kinase [Halioglobus sp.]